MRRSSLIHLILTLALLLNGPAMSMGRMAAMGDTNSAEGQSADSSSAVDCADAAMDMSQVPAENYGTEHSYEHSGSCCSGGGCHCSISSASVGSKASLGSPALTLAYLANSDSDAPPSPAPVRHFRPPIR